GATFTVSLPVMAVNKTEGVFTPGAEAVAEAATESTVAAGLSASLQESPKLEGVAVLIVDDDADAREMLDFMLTRYGAEIRMAASAQEAVDILAHWRPAVLVSDIGLPDEDGYVLIHQLKAYEEKYGRAIPAIALTGYTGKQNRERLLSAGFHRHL